MNKILETYELHIVTTEDLLPIRIIIDKDFLGALKISIPEVFTDRAELTRILRTIADELDKNFPD